MEVPPSLNKSFFFLFLNKNAKRLSLSTQAEKGE